MPSASWMIPRPLLSFHAALLLSVMEKESPSVSAAGEKILVTAWKDAGKAAIAVQDHGRGIPQEEIPHMFERFYRSRHSREKGSGLGLTIIKSIGERHNIDVSLQSAVHKGTTITFSLQIEQA